MQLCRIIYYSIIPCLLYMFRVVLPPIIRSAYNCIYSICYLSHRYCYLPLTWKSLNRFECAVGGVRHCLSNGIILVFLSVCLCVCVRARAEAGTVKQMRSHKYLYVTFAYS
jgi:hypothetical protein